MQLIDSINLVSRFKRVKELILHRLDNTELKTDALINRFEHLEQWIQSHLASLSPPVDTLLAPPSDPQQTITVDSDSGRLWPWNYQPADIPSVLPSGRPWPKISVVTPSYNHGTYIEETIRSVLCQRYPNLEYIVVDGGSTDNTLEILQRYKHQLAICISEPDEGQTNALNKGFNYATGDILAWLNSDDQYLPDTLIKVAKAFDTYNCDLIAGNCQLIRDHNRAIIQTHQCSFPVNQISPLPYQSMLDFGGDWLQGKFFFQPEVFWNRHAWELIGESLNENLNFGMDYDLWLRMARQKVTACHIDSVLATFRVYDGQKTIFSGNLADYPEYIAISRFYQNLDGIKIPDRERQIVEFSRVDGQGTETVDITATFPPDKFSDRPLIPYSTSMGQYYLPLDGTLGTVARKIRCGKLAFPEVVDAVRQYVKPKSVVIEIGSDFGQTTCLLAKMTGNEGQVLTFESDPYLFQALQKTLAVNHLYNVRPYFCETDGEKSNNSIVLDDLNLTEPVSFLKISMNECEIAAILKNATATILKDNPVIIVEGNPETYSDIVQKLGYAIEKTKSDHWCLLKPPHTLSIQVQKVDAEPIHFAPLPDASLCKFLKSREEVEHCTRFLHRNGFASHNLICKDWDLAHLVSEIGDGNFLDMGSSDSYILKNLTLKRVKGDLYGIDLCDPDVPIPRVTYLKGNLIETGLPSQHFRNISCLSVIEHDVDYDCFAKEASRLLELGGRLFVTFDYWEPEIIPVIRLYDLAWKPLNKQKLLQFMEACDRQRLKLIQDMDWTLGDPVIHYGYYAPHPTIKYTFGMAVFEKY